MKAHAACQELGPKIVLNHVYMYVYMYIIYPLSKVMNEASLHKGIVNAKEL